MISNGNFPLKYADRIEYKDVEVGTQDESELQDAIDASRGPNSWATMR